MQLSESQVSASKLADIFSNAFMEVSELTENEFKVKPENFVVDVRVESEKKNITVSKMFVLNNISLEQAALMANDVNGRVFMVRFIAGNIEEYVVLVVDYAMTYEKGLIAHQLVNNVRWFEKATFQCVYEFFRDYLM